MVTLPTKVLVYGQLRADDPILPANHGPFLLMGQLAARGLVAFPVVPMLAVSTPYPVLRKPQLHPKGAGCG